MRQQRLHGEQGEHGVPAALRQREHSVSDQNVGFEGGASVMLDVAYKKAEERR